MYRKVRSVKQIIYIFMIFILPIKADLNSNEFRKEFSLYIKEINDDPMNCFALGQVAAMYQACHELNKSINIYKKIYENCPQDIHGIFQLGVNHLIIGDEKSGEKFIDISIDRAFMKNNIPLWEELKNQKNEWINEVTKHSPINWEASRAEALENGFDCRPLP